MIAKNQIDRNPNLRLQNFLISNNNVNRRFDDKSENTTTTTNPLIPLYYILRIFSLDPSETNLFLRKTRGITLAALVCYASYWSFTGRIKYVYTHILNIMKVTDVFDLVMNGSVCVFNILSCSLSSPAKHDKARMKCDLIDRLLGVNQVSLYSINKKWIVKVLCLILSLLIAMSCFDFYVWSKSFDFVHSTRYIIDYLFNFVNTLVICHLVTHLHVLWSRFYILNEHLELYSQNIIQTSFYDKYCSEEMSKEPGFMCVLLNQDQYSKLSRECFKMDTRRIDNLMKVYMTACDLADLWNSYFAVQMLLAAMSSVISVLRALRIAVMFAEGGAGLSGTESAILPMVTTIIASIFVIFILFIVIVSCVCTMTEAKRTSLILDMILYNTCSDISEDTQKLEAWSQLMVRRSPKFTACQLFPIDFHLVLSITGTVVTYFIIIVQIKD